MSGEEKIYTEGELKLLVEISAIKSNQVAFFKTFTDHTEDDSEHFDRLYKSDKEIVRKLDSIPKSLVECSNRIKEEIMEGSRREFTKETDFQVFKTKIMTGIIVGIALGSVLATVISMIISSVKLLH